MSKKFYAINKETGEKWKPKKGYKQFLILYDSGIPAVVTVDFYIYMEPLDTSIWRLVTNFKNT